MKTAVVGLGEAVQVTALSPVYETAAWGVEDQEDFLNMCLAGMTALPPFDLLAFVKDLEKKIGRQERIRWGPREIDIDILIYEELVVRSDLLDVPHKGVVERATVLVPLADIAPDLVHPLTGRTISEHLAEVDMVGVRPLRPSF